MSNGSTTADLAEKAGIGQPDVMSAMGVDVNKGVNPDALVGGILNQKKAPPVVVNSDLAKNQALRDKNTTNNISSSYVPPGFTKNAQGQLIPIPGYVAPGTELNTNNSTDNKPATDTAAAPDPTKALGDSVIDNLTTDYNTFKGQFDALAGKFTADENATVDAIKSFYANSLSLLNDTIARQTQAATTAGIRSGVARFDPTGFSIMISKPAMDSISKISDLADKEKTALTAAQQAGDDNQFKVLQEQAALAKSYNSDKSAELTRLSTIAKNDAADTAAKVKADATAKQNELVAQQKARTFALANNITKPFYMVGDSIIDTATGEVVDQQAVNSALGLDNTATLEDAKDSIDTDVVTRAAAALAAKNAPKTADDFTHVSATKTQPAGTFNKKTGVFTPDAGSKPLGSDTGSTASKTTLTPTDKKKMQAQGLDPNNKADVDKYIKSAYSSNPKTDTNTLKSQMDAAIKGNNLVGKDGKVSYETYMSMEQNWTANGGTAASFKIQYPIGNYLDAGNKSQYLNATK
jgi:hypothetical protein